MGHDEMHSLAEQLAVTLAAALKHAADQETVGDAPDGCHTIHPDRPYQIVACRDQALQDVILTLGMDDALLTDLIRYIDHVHPLLQMQLSGTSVLQPVIIVDPVGHITVLLHLQELYPGRDRMDRSRIDLDEINRYSRESTSGGFETRV